MYPNIHAKNEQPSGEALGSSPPSWPSWLVSVAGAGLCEIPGFHGNIVGYTYKCMYDIYIYRCLIHG